MSPDPDRRRWTTRRRNAYRGALGAIMRTAIARGGASWDTSAAHFAPEDLALLCLAFATVCDSLAYAIPPDRTELPRGYRWGRNSNGEPSVIKDGQFLAPGVGDPLPAARTALEFARDLSSGWLEELALSLGLPGSYSLAEAIE